MSSSKNVKGLCGRCLSDCGPLLSYDPIPPPPALCVRVFCILIHTGNWWGGGGKKLTREMVSGATVYKAGSKIPTWLTLSPVYKLVINTCLKVPLQVNFVRWRHFALVSIKFISQWIHSSSLQEISSERGETGDWRETRDKRRRRENRNKIQKLL